MVIVETKEGTMEVDFDKLEVYVKRVDISAPMVQVADGRWIAEQFWGGPDLVIVKNNCHVSITIKGQMSPIGSTLCQ